LHTQSQILEVWGDFACFSRPELKVERFSYPAPTPSAVRGIFEAIYCKPKEFRWQVTKIEILTPIAYIALRRNEVKEKINVSAVAKWMNGTQQAEPIWADGTGDEKGRTQRQTMALRNVRYRVHAAIEPWPGFEAQMAGLEAQFRRRAAQGKCFYQPYFGCREFVAFFQLIEAAESTAPAAVNLDLGWMLYDVFDLSRPGASHDAATIALFKADVRDGVMHVPPYADAAVRKIPGGLH